MYRLLILILISSSLHADVSAIREFPVAPESMLTPGSLCDRPDSYRYPERIPYCERDSLDTRIKDEVFKEYRENGYRLNPKHRSDYKIDHLIPLCAGGSNREDNLWPQHKTLYVLTDPLEPLGCDKLKQGKITQAVLVHLIISAKVNLSLVRPTLEYLRKL
jgi:hypothetical protein